MNFKRRCIATLFAAVTLGGCATMKDMDSTCVEKNGTKFVFFGILFENRADKYVEECTAGKAAATIAGMRKADGSPDFSMYALAESLYRQSNPLVKDYMEKALKEDLGMSITQLRVNIVLGTLTNEDGSKNMESYKTVSSLYAAADKPSREYIDNTLAALKLPTIEKIREAIELAKDPVICEPVEIMKPDGTSVKAISCTDRRLTKKP